jgi:hypothetical protein
VLNHFLPTLKRWTAKLIRLSNIAHLWMNASLTIQTLLWEKEKVWLYGWAVQSTYNVTKCEFVNVFVLQSNNGWHWIMAVDFSCSVSGLTLCSHLFDFALMRNQPRNVTHSNVKQSCAHFSPLSLRNQCWTIFCRFGLVLHSKSSQMTHLCGALMSNDHSHTSLKKKARQSVFVTLHRMCSIIICIEMLRCNSVWHWNMVGDFSCSVSGLTLCSHRFDFAINPEMWHTAMLNKQSWAHFSPLSLRNQCWTIFCRFGLVLHSKSLPNDTFVCGALMSDDHSHTSLKRR